LHSEKIGQHSNSKVLFGSILQGKKKRKYDKIQSKKIILFKFYICSDFYRFRFPEIPKSTHTVYNAHDDTTKIHFHNIWEQSQTTNFDTAQALARSSPIQFAKDVSLEK